MSHRKIIYTKYGKCRKYKVNFSHDNEYHFQMDMDKLWENYSYQYGSHPQAIILNEMDYAKLFNILVRQHGGRTPTGMGGIGWRNTEVWSDADLFEDEALILVKCNNDMDGIERALCRANKKLGFRKVT